MSKYSVIAEDIIKKIIAGNFAGDKLPPFPKLAKDYNVSLQTAVRVVKYLESKGVVTCYPGNVGTRINRSHAILLSEHTVAVSKETDHKLVQPPRKKIRVVLSPYVGKTESFIQIAEKFSAFYPWIDVELLTSQEINDEMEQLSADAVIVLPNTCHALGKRGLLIPKNELPEYRCNALDFLPAHAYGAFFSWTVPVLFARKESPALESWEQILTDDRLYVALHVGLDTFAGYLLGNFEHSTCREDYIKLIHILHTLYDKALPGANLWSNALSSYQQKDCPVNMICSYYSGKNNFNIDFDEWEVRQIPATFSGDRHVPLFGYMLGVCKNASNPQEAWLWNNWLLRKESQEHLLSGGNTFSVDRDVFAAQKKLEPETGIAEQILQHSNIRELSHCFKYRFCSFASALLEQYFKQTVSLEKTVDELMQNTRDLVELDTIFHH